LVKLDAPGVLVDRDYTSAIFARAFYFEGRDDVEPWRREIARLTRENQPALEPPVTEWLASVLYRLVGREDMRLGRLPPVAFWLAGGWFLFLVVRRLVSLDGAVFALAYYLFVPRGVLLSRSFQPDALMMLGFLGSLYLLVRYHQTPSTRGLLSAGAAAGITLLYRPLVMPALVGAFLVPVVEARGVARALRHRAALAYLGLACTPAFLYYGYATFVARSFGWKLTSSFMPGLLLHIEYWGGWADLALLVAGAGPLAVGTLGVLLLRPGLPRSVAIGLAAGYGVFGLLFTYHIHTHGYYSAQLIPLVGLAAAPLADVVFRHLRMAPGRVLKAVAIGLTAGIVGAAVVLPVRAGLQGARFVPPAVAREIGELVEHSPRVVWVAPYYGLALSYLGEFTGVYWPRASTEGLYRAPGERALSIAERWAQVPFEPEYVVITHFSEYEENHPDLAVFLRESCLLKASAEAYLIYERCVPPGPGPVRP